MRRKAGSSSVVLLSLVAECQKIERIRLACRLVRHNQDQELQG
jgi:hypothetical protein